MKQNEKYLKEGLDILNREFGQPLPTLEDTMKAHKLKQEGGPGSGRPAKPGGAKDIDNKISKDADDANDRLYAAEKEMERKAKEQAFKDMENEEINEQGVLSRRAGINVFGDRKLQLMTKNLRQTAFDLEKVAKKKDEQAFDDILQRITITIGVMRSFLNKPKRRM